MSNLDEMLKRVDKLLDESVSALPYLGIRIICNPLMKDDEMVLMCGNGIIKRLKNISLDKVLEDKQ